MHWPHSIMEMHLQNRIQRRWQNMYRYMLILNRSWWIRITVDISGHVELTLFMNDVTPICGRNVTKSITVNTTVIYPHHNSCFSGAFSFQPLRYSFPKMCSNFLFLYTEHLNTCTYVQKDIYTFNHNSMLKCLMNADLYYLFKGIF